MPSSPNTFLFNNFQPVVRHRRITAGQIIGKTSACECSSGRAIRRSRETMSVLTIKRNEEFKRYSVMGEKGATATCDTHKIVIMMFRRKQQEHFSPRASAECHCCTWVLICGTFSVEFFRLFFLSWKIMKETQKHIESSIRLKSQWSNCLANSLVILCPFVSCGGLWEDAAVLWENQCRHKENLLQPAQKMFQALQSNPQPSCFGQPLYDVVKHSQNLR